MPDGETTALNGHDVDLSEWRKKAVSKEVCPWKPASLTLKGRSRNGRTWAWFCVQHPE